MATTAKIDPVDVHLGGQMRLRRRLLGLTHGTLGTAADMTTERIHALENGEIRITPAEIHTLSEALDVPVSFFFDGLAASTGWWKFWGVDRRRGGERRAGVDGAERSGGERRAGSRGRRADD